MTGWRLASRGVTLVAPLRESRADGYVSVEVFNFDEGPEAIATRSLEYLKRTFSAPAPA